MKKLLAYIMAVILCAGLASCATVVDDIAGPAEPADTDTLENRAEPESMEGKYNPEVEEEIESIESPLETQEMEDAPLIK